MTNARRGTWLVKPLRSGGGHRIRMWCAGDNLPRDCYVQELVDGIAGSIVFVAAAGEAAPIGISRLLAGDAAFGATGFRYCGNILDTMAARQAVRLARVAAREFDLIGVNGVDFIVRRQRVHPIEVNPRWTASMELVERAYGLSVFGAHVDACVHNRLPDFDLASARRGGGTIGKAVVFARRDVTAGDTSAWLTSPDVRDVPHPGEIIRAGRPICTVFAAGRDVAGCYANLVKHADWVYAETRAWERRIA